MHNCLQINKELISKPMIKEAENMNGWDTEEDWVTNEHMESVQPR